MANILDRVRQRLLAAGAQRWHAIADVVNAGRGEDDRITFHTLRKIAYKDAKNPGIKTVQALLDFFAEVDRGERELPEPAEAERAA